MPFRVRERDKTMARGRRNQTSRMKWAGCDRAFKYEEGGDRITNVKRKRVKRNFS